MIVNKIKLILGLNFNIFIEYISYLYGGILYVIFVMSKCYNIVVLEIEYINLLLKMYLWIVYCGILFKLERYI